MQRARTWDLVEPQAWFTSPWLRVHHEIPQGDKGLLSRYTVTAEQAKAANMAQLEHVTVTMNVNHTRRGDISVDLRSPAGIVSHLSVSRESDNHPGGYEDWTFMSVAHWYVPRLSACDLSANSFLGVNPLWVNGQSS